VAAEWADGGGVLPAPGDQAAEAVVLEACVQRGRTDFEKAPRESSSGGCRPAAAGGRVRGGVGRTGGDRVEERRAGGAARGCLAGARTGSSGGLARAMLEQPPSVRIYLAAGATDLRRSIDGWSALVPAHNKEAALDGRVQNRGPVGAREAKSQFL
jgi:hypothetical protein